MADLEVKCSDCEEVFVVTDGEQQFLRETFGETFSAPKRCKACRQKRKAAKGQPREQVQQEPPRPSEVGNTRREGKGRKRQRRDE